MQFADVSDYGIVKRQIESYYFIMKYYLLPLGESSERLRRVCLHGPLEPDLAHTSGGKWRRTFGHPIIRPPLPIFRERFLFEFIFVRRSFV